MSVFAPSVVNLWKTIESYGLDAAALFLAEEIKISLPVDPCLRLPYEKIDRIRAQAVKLSGDEAFGLRSAAIFAPAQLGALGYAWLASMNLRNACLRLERFIRVLNVKARARVADSDGNMVVTMQLNLPTVSGFARDDSALAILARMCRLVYGESFRLAAVNFNHAEPHDIQPYFEYFGCKLFFDQPENQLLIPLPQVDVTLIGANPELALLNDQVSIRRLALLDRHDVVARVQAALIDQLPLGNISDESIAQALHMSARTLHRKLAKTDRNFRLLLVEMRRELAERYIMDNSLTLTEISLLLGFSEQSSFSRAFKNWTGKAPSEARQART